MPRGQKKQIVERNTSKPALPKELDDAAIVIWNSIVADLESTGTLHSTDEKIIKLYSQGQSLLDKVESKLPTLEYIEKGDKGRSFLNPLLNFYTTLRAQQKQFLSELGLTPSTRKGSSEEDELAIFTRNNAK